jgi:hypothetical protein
MSVLTTETKTERSFIERIRTELRTKLEDGSLSISDAGRRLGLVPEGVTSLLQREWSLQTAFRTADALGLDFPSALAPGGNGGIVST